ncbi:MAG: hypothetical protein ABII71_04445 [Candidatus Micrarchaeota archaeon]
MQTIQRTRMQKAKEILTTPITIKGMISAVASVFRRKPEPDRISRPQVSKQRVNLDSGLWSLPTRNGGGERAEDYRKMKVEALELRKQAALIREDGTNMDPLEADMLDLQAVAIFIEMGWVQEAAMVGFDFEQRGNSRDAANVYMLTRNEDAFFGLVDRLQSEGNHEMAVNVVRWNSGLRGVVKYNEMYKQPNPKLLADFKDEEILEYAREMRFQRKKHHVFQLAEICEGAERFGLAAELYGLIRLCGAEAKCRKAEAMESASEMLRGGRFLEAGEHLLGFNMAVEVHEIAEAAAMSGKHREAASLFEMTGDRKRMLDNGFVAVLETLDNARQMCAQDDRFNGIVLAQEEWILKTALELYRDGMHREAYEIAAGLREIGSTLRNPRWNGRILLNASLIYRGAPGQAPEGIMQAA